MLLPASVALGASTFALRSAHLHYTPFYYVAYTESGSVNLIYYLKGDCRRGGDIYVSEVHNKNPRGNSYRLPQGKFQLKKSEKQLSAMRKMKP